MSTAASWMLALLWLSILALAELAVILAAWHLAKRFPETVGYVRSAFDDPVWDGKASMSRASALISLVAAIWTARELIRYLTSDKATVGVAGVIAGVITTFTALAASFVLRKRADGSTEPVEDERPTPQPPPAPAVIATAQVTTQPAPPAVPDAPPS